MDWLARASRTMMNSNNKYWWGTLNDLAVDVGQQVELLEDRAIKDLAQ
jgi:hypothetical protein